MFEAYITNTALYPLMGIEVGTTVHFPMTTQELQAALAKIGIDGKRYSEVFFTSFDSDVLGLYDHLYECENIDELNELGHALLEVRDKGGLETFEAALVLGNHTRSVKDFPNIIIRKTKPLGHYGRLRKAYLEMHRPILFNELVLSDKLFEHCAEIDEAARNRMELIVRSLAEQNGVTEQLKADNQMEWVRQMNACKAQAEEIVKAELIYD